MKIKEFSIIRYGPLSKMEQISLGNFNLFFGRNEEGKTLTIDALVKMLLRKNVRDFAHINRVEENPEGYVIIENKEKKEVKLPEKGDLTKLAGLTSSECRNIFIIRNSDLSIAAESEFYTNVTDRLTGLKTRQILSIKKKLQELGKLTAASSSAVIADRKEFGKIGSRLRKANTLIEEIDGLRDEVKKETFDELEEEYAIVGQKIDEAKQKLEVFEEARRRQKHEKGKRALGTLRRAIEKKTSLAAYSEEDEETWRYSERDVETNRKEKEKLLLKLKEREREFQAFSGELRERERRFRTLEERKKEVEGEITPRTKEYQEKSGQLTIRETKDKLFTLLLVAFVAIFGVSLLGIMVASSLLFYILAGVFLAFGVVVGWVKFKLVKDRGLLRELFKEINFKASRFGLGGGSIEEIILRIQEFGEDFTKKVGELEETRGEKRLLERAIKELNEERIVEIEERIGNAQEKIEALKRKAGEESLAKYSRKLKLKLELEKSANEQQSILNTILGEEGNNVEEGIMFWDKEIKELEIYKNKARGVEHNEKSILELKEKEGLLEENLKRIKSTMSYFHKELAEVERKVNEILGVELEEDYLYCKTLVDLEAIENRLQEFIGHNETKKDSVLEVMRIFEEIEREEKEKVSELFGEESPVSQHFKEITGGLYNKVVFGQERGKIEVERKDGLILDSEKLSGGAYDQLYLSIRLALGEKLLEGKKGFFIMDDPFIKASPDRLRRQMKVLKKICNSGWQIIYFTAKGEVKEALKEDIDSRMVNYVEVRSRL